MFQIPLDPDLPAVWPQMGSVSWVGWSGPDFAGPAHARGLGGWEWLGLWPVGKGERRWEDKDEGLSGRASSALALCAARVPCGLVPWFSFQPHFKKFYLFHFFLSI